MRTFGLIGKKLEHSFSAEYFNNKFQKEGITDAKYINFELDDISKIQEIIITHKIYGLNVTIPYKEKVIPFLDELNNEAKKIGAVNTIRFKDKKLIGYNTDYIGFKKSLEPLLAKKNTAIILGDGGAAKAIKHALKKLHINYISVDTRKSLKTSHKIYQSSGYHKIIINTTPVGSFPETNNFPDIPYQHLNTNHLLFDLIYNPRETKFLEYGRKHNSKTKNGLEMLKIQAEESWKIWNL